MAMAPFCTPGAPARPPSRPPAPLSDGWAFVVIISLPRFPFFLGCKLHFHPRPDCWECGKGPGILWALWAPWASWDRSRSTDFPLTPQRGGQSPDEWMWGLSPICSEFYHMFATTSTPHPTAPAPRGLAMPLSEVNPKQPLGSPCADRLTCSAARCPPRAPPGGPPAPCPHTVNSTWDLLPRRPETSREGAVADQQVGLSTPEVINKIDKLLAQLTEKKNVQITKIF